VSGTVLLRFLAAALTGIDGWRLSNGTRPVKRDGKARARGRTARTGGAGDGLGHIA